MPLRARAQGEPIRLGILTPLTGAGGTDGPRMLKAMQAVVEEVNKAGGVLGRKIETVVEDDQTNPEAAVRAARKLIDVDKVPVIMGTWASAVTTAVAPVCWESKTFLMHRVGRGHASPSCRTRATSSARSRTPSCRRPRMPSSSPRIGKQAGRRARHPGAVRAADQGAPRRPS